MTRNARSRIAETGGQAGESGRPRRSGRGSQAAGGGQDGGARPPRAVSGWRIRTPEPSLRPSAAGKFTGTPASVAPRAGPGPAQASTRVSSPLRNLWQRTPPVARPLGGYSRYGVTFAVAAPVPGSAPVLPATVTTTGSPVPAGAVPTTPNQATLARADSRMPAIPPAARPCGRT